MGLLDQGMLTYAFIIPIFLFVGQILFRGLRNPLNAIPGPTIAKWVNWRLKFAVITGRKMFYIHSLHHQYGPYVRISPNEVAISDPEGFDQIHQIGSGFTKTDWYAKLTQNERDGVFALTDPKKYAARRRLLARGFSKTYLRQFWEPVVREKVELTVSKMIEETREKGVADVFKWWTLMTADVSTHLFFGASFNSIETGEVSEFIQALKINSKGKGIGLELPLVAIIGRHLPFESPRTLFGTRKVLMDTAELAVTNAHAHGEKNLFAQIIREVEKGEKLDEIDLKIEAVSFIIAGSDTTAVTLTYLVWAVLSQPETMRELCQELEVLPENYNDNDLEHLPILTAVIEETLRLHGAAPGGLPRAVPVNGAHIGGYFFPAGSVVTTQAYTIHRDTEVFPNPTQFDYKRWLAQDKSHGHLPENPDLNRMRAVFHPFGGGSRTCIGINLAQMELRLGATEFFRRCNKAGLGPRTTPESMDMQNYFLISPLSHRCEVVAV